MKKWVISLFTVFLLTGCDASSELERGMALRSSMLKAGSCSMDVQITADYIEHSSVFSLSSVFDSSGNMSFTVTEPDSISGINGRIVNQKGNIIFDDSVLYFDLLGDERLSPISAPWIFMKALRSGYIRSVGQEDGLLRLTVDDSYADDALQVDIWVNEKNEPVRAEIVHDNRRILSLEVENLEIL